MTGSVSAKRLTASLEDYLEAILVLERRGRVARVRDIAGRLGVGMPSVTAALKALSKKGLVNYDPYQVVTLTNRGGRAAAEVTRRHMILRRFLAEVLGLSGELAEANACRMEHAADDSLLDKLAALAEFLGNCPRVRDAWLDRSAKGCAPGEDSARCRDCIAELAAGIDQPPSGGDGKSEPDQIEEPL